MNKQEFDIPVYTLHNIQLALGDVLRAAMAFGDASSKAPPTPDDYAYVAQYVAQLLALILQRTPTSMEVAAVFDVPVRGPGQ